MGEVEVHVLRGVDLELLPVNSSYCWARRGAASQLLNILVGLDGPTGGAVHFREQNLTAVSEEQLTCFRSCDGPQIMAVRLY